MTIDPQTLIQRLSVEELCQTAEDYFRAHSDPTPHIAKPFFDHQQSPEMLQNLGLLLSGLHLAKGMSVLDFGAGACWISRLLTQMQCRTISCDPSPTALAMGEQAFKDYPVMGKPIAEPTFLPFDGRHIALPDASVERILCFDAFHHVPNQGEILAEFARVLSPGGIAGFSEPGRYHSQTPISQHEMTHFDVLENDIRVEDIFKIARRFGFTDIAIKLLGNLDLSLDEYRRIIQPDWRAWRLERQMVNYLRQVTTNKTIFFLHKGPYRPDSRSSQGLDHQLEVAPKSTRLALDTPLPLTVYIANRGQSRWLCENFHDIGVVKLGVHLCDGDQRVLNWDFLRCGLPQILEPGERLTLKVELVFPHRGHFCLAVDLVAEYICWFEHVGAKPAWVDVEVY